ncbi:protein of unknown function; putative exported protein [Methylorubrum extorquens DM4]|uniref:Uncharacterized protein n=1 Tax=Methylorubrum extorquens (strain DSM 6343 / CIP 106787 / DM4) TaxID=661410 RepID=C7CKU8_METED|nr:protein of unknown function; putative exported protein [Methylorubrum extorquens DM4]
MQRFQPLLQAGAALLPPQLVADSELDGFRERNALPLDQEADEAVRFHIAEVQGHKRLAGGQCRKPVRMMYMPAKLRASRDSSQDS